MPVASGKPGAGNSRTVDRRRRRWSEAQKRQIVAESHEPGGLVSVVARRYNVNANQVFTWRWLCSEAARDAGAGRLVPMVVEAPSDGEVGASASCPSSGDGVAAAGRIEIALPGGARVIVDREVDGVALNRVGIIEGELGVAWLTNGVRHSIYASWEWPLRGW